MNSLEALNIIKNKGESFCEAYEEPLKTIQQDLERFKIIEENYYSLNKQYEWIEFENVRLEQENKKLKQVIDIFERTHIHIYYLRRTKNVEEYNKMIDKVNEYDFFDYLIQEDYDLLKEMLGYD